MVTSSNLSPWSLATRLHSHITRKRKVLRATTTCRPQAILDTAANPNMSTNIPDPALDTSLPAPDKDDQSPAT